MQVITMCLGVGLELMDNGNIEELFLHEGGHVSIDWMFAVPMLFTSLHILGFWINPLGTPRNQGLTPGIFLFHPYTQTLRGVPSWFIQKLSVYSVQFSV